MTENVENLKLEHQRSLRAGQDRIENKLTGRVSAVENQVAHLHKSVALIQEDMRAALT